MQDIQLVVFDLAGTTIEDSGQVQEAFTKTLGDHGIRVTPEMLHSVRGASKRQVIRSFISIKFADNRSVVEERTNQIFHAFRECLSQIYLQNGVREVPGSLQTFEWLRNQRIKIAVNTGFDRWLTDVILKNVGWDRKLFESVVCGDDVEQGRPAPDLILLAMKSAAVTEPNQVANVGDTVLDLQAGANASVKWNIGVLSGAHKKEDLMKFPHTYLISSVADLPSLWE